MPVNLARNIMDQILKNGKVTRARLGILPQDVTPTIARQFGVKDSQGALVGEVEANSPAQKAGLKTGDIILDVNGHSVYDANQLRNMISSMQPDSNVNLKIWRDGAQHTLPVTLGELNPEEATNRGGAGGDNGSGRRAGRSLGRKPDLANRAGSETPRQRRGCGGERSQPGQCGG